jgi:endonuclease YncB( thermonuclease family)
MTPRLPTEDGEWAALDYGTGNVIARGHLGMNTTGQTMRTTISRQLIEASAKFKFYFPAEIDSWHDGDTCSVHRTAWPGLVIHGEHIRVQGINAPELHAAGGIASRDFANTLAPPGSIVTLIATGQEKYGRFLAKVILPGGANFGDKMIAANQAVPFMVT